MQVHEEVLRLFSATVGKLSAEQLAKYLQMTLQHSRKSRKCASSASMPPMLTLVRRCCTHSLCTPTGPQIWWTLLQRPLEVRQSRVPHHACMQAHQEKTG